MSARDVRDEGPVYYREIQKNAYLKRVPSDTGSKLRPLGHKKLPLRPMWTLFCVHNGRVPYLEQYPDAESAATLAHKPVWRVCLQTTRHVTASVKPRAGDEHDFLIHTESGNVTMLAPDWESMQDWVNTLRSKLVELKILSKGENVYCAPPAAPPPRAAARDPTSPLPPTPPVPPDRVPGIELTTPLLRSTQPPPTIPETTSPPPEPPPVPTEPVTQLTQSDVDISSWDTLPSTSQSVSQSLRPVSQSVGQSEEKEKLDPKKSVAKICGQNICLDDSILKRRDNTGSTDSDEEFFAEIDRIHDSAENLNIEDKPEYKQRLVVNDKPGLARTVSETTDHSDRQATNITVIQVSNKPPHTAIPVMGAETNVFDFNFQQNLSINSGNHTNHLNNDNDVNVRKLSVNVVTTSNQTGNLVNVATMSNQTGNQENQFINIVNTEVNVNDLENGYGTVFDKDSQYGHLSLTTTVNLTGNEKKEGIYERLCLASTSMESPSPLPIRKIKNSDKVRKSSLPNLDSSTDSTYEYLFPNQNITLNSTQQNLVITNESRNNNDVARTDIRTVTNNSSKRNGIDTDNTRSNETERHINVANEVRNEQRHIVTNLVSVNSDQRRVERSHSQNTYDNSQRIRELLRRRQCSPKRDGKNDKSEPAAKPIWKRGLTELSLLSRLRGIGHTRRQDSPTRQDTDRVQSSVKVVHRPRAEARVDSGRRRSSSLSNGQSVPIPGPPLQTLRSRQAAALRAEQRRGAAVAGTFAARDPPVFVDYDRQVWVARWGGGGGGGGRAGDRVAALRGVAPRDAAHARQLLKGHHHPLVEILFHRVPLGKIYVFNKRDMESIGVKLDNECNITSVEPSCAAARAGLPPPGKWAVTEVNNRPINLLKGGEEEMNRLSLHGSEVSVLIQPSALVKKLRAAIKSNKPLLSLR